MIDLAVETLLTLEQAGERLLVSKATLYRWITVGMKGVKLEAARVGGRWRTSEEALQRFSDCLTPNQEPSHASASSLPTLKERRRHSEEVERSIDEIFGIRRCEACRAEIVAPKRAIPKGQKVWCPACLVKRKSATLGQRIRTFRWAALLSLDELSNRVGFGIDKIRAYEFDEKEPTEAHVAKLIEVFGNQLVSGLAPRGKCNSHTTEA